MPAEDARIKWRKPKSAKELLLATGAPIDAASLLDLLCAAHLATWAEYVSTTGSGEIKKYRVLTESGLRYGVNASTAHPSRTECRFYADTFPALLQVAAQTLTSFSQRIVQAETPGTRT